MTRTVVFAYHNVGVRCVEVLVSRGVQIALIVTHEDDPAESRWFESVAERAWLYGIPVVAPSGPNRVELIERIRRLSPDILFSFYYRRMLGRELLALPPLGAFNMHGSLLPNYRGRAPVNWAIVNGERETGATLHEMTEAPDAGHIIDRQAVPILRNDVAREVFDKVTVAAEIVLHRSLAALLDGTARREPQDLSRGGYYGRRGPADGAIDISWPADRIHNLVRAVAPPYPGAFCAIAGKRLELLRTFDDGRCGPRPDRPMLFVCGGKLHLRCMDGRVLAVLAAQYEGIPLDADAMRATFGEQCVPIESAASLA